jgi:hypothetical protein
VLDAERKTVLDTLTLFEVGKTVKANDFKDVAQKLGKVKAEDKAIEVLSQLGAQGWELVTSVDNLLHAGKGNDQANVHTRVWTFKRAK